MDSGGGDDQLFGEAGEDSIIAGAGRDLIQGGADNDTLLGQDNNDTIFGGDGSDSISGDQGDDTILAGAGNDTALGGIGDDSIFGEAGNDSILGDQGNDSVFAGAGEDIIFGFDDNDLIFGDGGNDTVLAGLGNDTLTGGAGSDRLTGNDGNDIFSYFNQGEGVDVITDFDILGDDQFLFVTNGTSSFPNLIPNTGSLAQPLGVVTVNIGNLGSSGVDISGRQLIVFQDTFDSVQGANAALKNQNGSGSGSALFIYRNNGFSGSYVLGFDPDLSNDSLPAFDLAILSSINPSQDNISTIIGPDDFLII
ncbi:MAG: calcium-binding protein [Oscillatoriales cyanobacterium RM1_1_9]|nr:calcium-binding protein [Oscillatoriales cyanobacterium RM1_1_9]